MPYLKPRRARRRGRGLLILLIVVILLAIVADRVGAYVAEREVAAKVQSSQNLSERPSVTIEGFPFLTQVIDNHYEAVTLSADNVTVGGQDRITVGSLTARLTGVRAIDHFSGVTATHVVGTANVSYSELSRVLGVPVSYAAGGRVQTTKSVTILGQTVTGTVSAVVTVPGGDEIAFSDVRVSAGAAAVAVPPAITSELSGVFARQLSLSGLPFGLRVQQLSVTPAAVSVTAAADNVTLG